MSLARCSTGRPKWLFAMACVASTCAVLDASTMIYRSTRATSDSGGDVPITPKMWRHGFHERRGPWGVMPAIDMAGGWSLMIAILRRLGSINYP